MEQTVTLPTITNEPPPAYPTLKESWASLGWFLLITIGLALIVFVPVEAIGQVPKVVKTGLLYGLAILSNALLVLWLRRRAGPERWLRVRWQVPRRPGLAAGLLLLIVPAAAVLLSVQHFLHLPAWAAGKQLATLAAHPVLGLLVGCVGAPVTEELLFRGVLLPGLLRNYSPAVAIGQTALLFGIFHFNPAQALNAFLLGLLLGWVYYRCRSLWLCIGLHGLFNGLVLGITLGRQLAGKPAPPSPAVQWASYSLLLLVAALVLAFSLRALARSQAEPTVAT